MSEICADVELGGHARRDVLAAGGGREQDVAVVLGDRQHLRGDVLGQAVRRGCAPSACSTLATPAICAAALAAPAGVGAGDQHMDVAAAACQRRGDGVEGGAGLSVALSCSAMTRLVMSQITFASFLSLATSVATSGTLMPAPRLGGSLTLASSGAA